MKKLVIVGGKGNGTNIASLIEDINRDDPRWELLGFFNDDNKIGDTLHGYSVIGKPEDMMDKKYKDVSFVYTFITMQYGKNNAKRLLEMDVPADRFPTLIHPSAVISRYTKIGHGLIIMPNVYIASYAEIGNHSTLLRAFNLGHGSSMSDFCYGGNNAVIGADVVMKEGAYIGTSAVTRERVTLGEWCIVGIGSVVIRDVPPMTVVAGNPAKKIKDRTFEIFTPKN